MASLELDPSSLDQLLADQSYVCGHLPTQADVKVWHDVGQVLQLSDWPHVVRWHRHIASFGDEVKVFPEAPVSVVFKEVTADVISPKKQKQEQNELENLCSPKKQKVQSKSQKLTSPKKQKQEQSKEQKSPEKQKQEQKSPEKQKQEQSKELKSPEKQKQEQKSPEKQKQEQSKELKSPEKQKQEQKSPEKQKQVPSKEQNEKSPEKQKQEQSKELKSPEKQKQVPSKEQNEKSLEKQKQEQSKEEKSPEKHKLEQSKEQQSPEKQTQEQSQEQQSPEKQKQELSQEQNEKSPEKHKLEQSKEQQSPEKQKQEQSKEQNEKSPEKQKQEQKSPEKQKQEQSNEQQSPEKQKQQQKSPEKQKQEQSQEQKSPEKQKQQQKSPEKQKQEQSQEQQSPEKQKQQQKSPEKQKQEQSKEEKSPEKQKQEQSKEEKSPEKHKLEQSKEQQSPEKQKQQQKSPEKQKQEQSKEEKSPEKQKQDQSKKQQSPEKQKQEQSKEQQSPEKQKQEQSKEQQSPEKQKEEQSKEQQSPEKQKQPQKSPEKQKQEQSQEQQSPEKQKQQQKSPEKQKQEQSNEQSEKSPKKQKQEQNKEQNQKSPEKQKQQQKPPGKKVDSEKKEKGGGDGGKGAVELNPWPEFIQTRLSLWDRLKKEADDALAAKVPEPITITLPDGATKDGKSWRTTPYEIAQGISQGLADNTIVARVNGVVWDLDRPLEGNCKLELLKFDDDEAKAVFWHSSAHMLGEAMERVYGGHLCYGPPIEEGFYYDMHSDGPGVSALDFPGLEDVVKKISKEKQPFERLEMKKEDLLEMFKYNKFKVRILEEKVKTPTTTVYRCGPLIDLCRGPHVRHTGKVKAFMVTKNSSSYWEGKSDAESLQRLYGVSFPDPKQLKEWKHFQEEAAKRDHRKIGVQQKLFFFHELSPGSCFFTPRGAYIYNTLIDFIRSEYRKRGFQEVITPNLYNTRLWQTSGHWEHYAENMFAFEVEKEKFALKPMNCPGHCLMFGNTSRSWRELPLRMADFGVLHRNELSGALTGLTRVRRFQQDDAHIFCAPEMIETEIKGCLEFLDTVYDAFGFEYHLNLSTRPEKFLGEVSMWDQAEEQLKNSLNSFGKEWKLNPGDGAFYGPKIDITVTDALRRQHQCATIQLDFQLPIRFDLQFVSETGEKRKPVIIHRAILGSVERMIAILTESFGGKWPFWLSPRQCMVVPVAPPFDDYAIDVKKRLHDAGFQADYDTDPGDTMNKKIRNAQLEQYNFILVVGEKEKTNGTVNVRTRDNKVHGEHSIDAVITKLTELQKNRVKNWEDSF